MTKYRSGTIAKRDDLLGILIPTGKGWSSGRKFVNHAANVVCQECGKKFFKFNCYIKRGHKMHFCSNPCRTSYMAKHPELFSQTQSRRGSGGRRADLQNRYFRSAWEANYARYLNWLKEHGEIHDWEYEPDTFEFSRIKRGTRFYTPDFKVWETTDRFRYHEVKGYMDPRSATKLNRMAKYFPLVPLIVIDKEAYYAIAKKIRPFIPEWEVRRPGSPT